MRDGSSLLKFIKISFNCPLCLLDLAYTEQKNTGGGIFTPSKYISYEFYETIVSPLFTLLKPEAAAMSPADI